MTRCITIDTIERPGRKDRVLISTATTRAKARAHCKKMDDMGIRCHVVCWKEK